jgi:hypothetical protein
MTKKELWNAMEEAYDQAHEDCEQSRQARQKARPLIEQVERAAALVSPFLFP